MSSFSSIELLVEHSLLSFISFQLSHELMISSFPLNQSASLLLSWAELVIMLFLQELIVLGSFLSSLQLLLPCSISDSLKVSITQVVGSHFSLLLPLPLHSLPVLVRLQWLDLTGSFGCILHLWVTLIAFKMKPWHQLLLLFTNFIITPCSFSLLIDLALQLTA